jgi:thiamine-phosphate pyrophosphorylase
MGQEILSRLYVVAAAGAAPESVGALLDASGAATLLIARGGDEPLTAATARPLVEMAQKKEVAALIEADAALARTLRADGVHLPWSKDIAAQYAEAREVLGTRYIVGVDVGRSRHDAMELAEGGADYIAFGIPPHVEDRAAAADRRRELISWWGEIFEVPCVAFDVESAEEAQVLAGAGADFIALRRDTDLNPADARDLAKQIAEAASQREAIA